MSLLYPSVFSPPSVFPFPRFCHHAGFFGWIGRWAQSARVSRGWKGTPLVSDTTQRRSSLMAPLSRRAPVMQSLTVTMTCNICNLPFARRHHSTLPDLWRSLPTSGLSLSLERALLATQLCLGKPDAWP